MTQNTVNYGFRIPNADGSDNIVPDDLRLPITAIDTKIKDRANEIAAVSATLTALSNSIGTWTDYTATIRTDVGAAAAPTTAVSFARYMKIGKTVIVYVEGTVGATLVSNASIMLPIAEAGTPKTRNLLAGSMQIINAGSPVAGQMGVARMVVAKDRVLTITNTGAFIDAPASSNIQCLCIYEVN